MVFAIELDEEAGPVLFHFLGGAAGTEQAADFGRLVDDRLAVRTESERAANTLFPGFERRKINANDIAGGPGDWNHVAKLLADVGNQVVLLELVGKLTWDSGIERLHRHGALAARQSALRSINAFHEVGGTAIRTFEPHPVRREPRWLAVHLVDIGACLWQVQRERPVRIFEVVVQLSQFLAAARDDLCDDGRGKRQKHARDNET